MTLSAVSASATYESLPSLHDVPGVRAAAAALVEAVRREGRARQLSRAAYDAHLSGLGERRGLPLAHPLLAGGAGQGAWVQLADGRRILDLVSGIGPYVFGHDDQDLLETAAIAAAADVAFQGHVLPGLEYDRLCEILLRHAGGRLVHAWLALSGSMANENAWKMILQRHAPADQVLVFENAFHGRTLAMAELTDRPAYREGLPIRNCVQRVPFYDRNDPASTQKSVDAIDRALAGNPGRIAAMCFELVQGEGGFNDAPPEFFRALMGRCREAGLAIWIDEIQTFGRTGELFAFQTLGLEELVDVVTAGKILHGSATLFSENYRPRPKLIAGTWAGSTVGMALGARILERLVREGYLGRQGHVARLEARLDEAFAALERRMPGVVRERSGLGAMQAFVAWDGDPAITAELVETCLEEGVLFQPAGSSPMKVRLLPPLCLTDAELDAGFASLERALLRVAQRHGLEIAAGGNADESANRD
jgi:acetylornithine/N-succinyldiaminopimelate aminotransferase